MMQLAVAFRGSGLMARWLRSASWVTLSYGASQALRLGANLILARLLFPEAFGLMALIGLVTVGLALFSDIGLGPAIWQSERGDDPVFLDTAWTMQVLRGVLLWVIACALAVPVAQFYDTPQLVQFLPVAALSLLLAGFNPMRLETATRHLLVGRATALELASQAAAVTVMVVLAALTGSVWALVVGTVIGAGAKLALTHLYLPGPRNRFRWEPAAFREILGFGKWIFLSTAFWFLFSQGDKAIFGKFLPLDTLGIYNIGYFMASFPMLLGFTLSQKLLIPVYRETRAQQTPQNAEKLRRLRWGMSLSLVALLALMGLAGPWLIEALYDPRYAAAGAIIVALALAQVPQAAGMSYDQAALAAGDSRGYFVFSAARALLLLGSLYVGVSRYGLIGGLAGMGLAFLAAHMVLIRLARAHGVWDPLHDAAVLGLGGTLCGLALWLHRDDLAALLVQAG